MGPRLLTLTFYAICIFVPPLRGRCALSHTNPVEASRLWVSRNLCIICFCQVTSSLFIQRADGLHHLRVVETTWEQTSDVFKLTSDKNQTTIQIMHGHLWNNVPLVESKNSCSRLGVSSSSSYSYACRIISSRSNSFTSLASALLWVSYSCSYDKRGSANTSVQLSSQSTAEMQNTSQSP